MSVVALLQMLYQITLPGLYYDEAYHAAYGAMILTGKTIPFVKGMVYDFFGLPVLASVSAPYVGPLQGYLALLSMFLLGINVPALRIVPILLTTASQPLLFFFVRNRFGTSSAYFATLLSTFQPSLLLYSRLGLWTSSMLVFFICSSLYCFDRWLSLRHVGPLAIGFFLLGLGLDVFVVFAWYIVALVVTTVVFRIKIHLRRHLPIVLACFVVGLGPYLLPWLTGAAPDYILRFARTSAQGIDNLAYADHLLLRLTQLGKLLDGSAGAAGVYVADMNPLAIPIFIASIVGIAFLAAAGRRVGDRTGRARLWLITMFSIILVQTPITIRDFNTLHLIPLLPFSFMIVGDFLGAAFEGALVRHLGLHQPRVSLRLCRAVVLLVLSLSVVLNVSVTTRYYMSLEQTGGVGPWSDAIYQAADYLTASNCTVVLAIDWGLSFPLLISSGGKLNVRDVYWQQDQWFRSEVNNWTGLVGTKRLCFISYSSLWRESYGAPNRLGLLQDMARALNESLILEKTFYQRDLTPVIDVYRIGEPPSTSSLPSLDATVQEIGLEAYATLAPFTSSSCLTKPVSLEKMSNGNIV
jgi:4-amino-4-deoxy-L-arabinose transferase-like glycosyltransferase